MTESSAAQTNEPVNDPRESPSTELPIPSAQPQTKEQQDVIRELTRPSEE